LIPRCHFRDAVLKPITEAMNIIDLSP
jgi:hypothetical protein